MNKMTFTSLLSKAGRNALLGSAFLSAALIAMPGFGTQSALAAGDLKVAQRRDPANLDPIDTFLLAWGKIGSNVFEGLVFRDEGIKLHPGLATKWEFLDNETRIRFTLRQGVKFHNGEPFNAAAVKYTFDRLLGEQGKKGPQRGNYTSIDHVEIVDDYTVDFMMARPDPVMITKLAGYGAMIVPPKYIEEVGEKEFDMHPVGTGPFKVTEYTPTVDVKLARFDDYWGEKAKVDTVAIRFIPEPSTRMNELLSGGIDIALDVPTTAIDTLEKNDKVHLLSAEGPTVRTLRMKVTGDAITSDIRVRKAINMAVNKDAIIQALLKGYGKPISSAQSALSFGNDPEMKGYPYDPAAAKALLKEAGVKPGTEITMDIRSSDDVFREVAQVISSFLGQIGLKVKIRLNETNVMSSEMIPQGKTGELFQFGWGGWTFDFDNTAYLLYHTGEHWNPYIDDEKLNALLDKERSTYDTEIREKALQEVARYAHENAFEIPLFNFSTLSAASTKVKGFVPAPDDRYRYGSVTIE